MCIRDSYYNDQTLDDVNLLYSGARELPSDFWESHGKELASWKDSGRTFYRVRGPEIASWHPNQGLFQADAETAYIVRQLRDAEAVIEIIKDHTAANHAAVSYTHLDVYKRQMPMVGSSRFKANPLLVQNSRTLGQT